MLLIDCRFLTEGVALPRSLPCSLPCFLPRCCYQHAASDLTFAASANQTSVRRRPDDLRKENQQVGENIHFWFLRSISSNSSLYVTFWSASGCANENRSFPRFADVILWWISISNVFPCVFHSEFSTAGVIGQHLLGAKDNTFWNGGLTFTHEPFGTVWSTSLEEKNYFRAGPCWCGTLFGVEQQ